MNGFARLRSSVPGRTVVAGLALWVATGCSVDEPTGVGKAAGRPALALVQGQGDRPLTVWGALGDDSLWKHVEASRGVVDVGLRAPGQASGMRRGRLLINASQRASGRGAVTAIKGVELLSADTLLPILRVKVTDRTALARLRTLPFVEYVEPGSFTATSAGRGLTWNDLDWGCNINQYGGPRDELYVAPYDLVPWNYRRMFIDSAWTWASGRGVTVGLVDTGVDDSQNELNGNFSSGWSSDRTFVKDWTNPYQYSPNFWDDACGHGTRMASVVGAPRNGAGTLGVAWGANMYAVRVDNDVILTEVSATREGIRRAAQRARVITMAFGTLAWYSSIAQELEYWYFNSDRVFFAAAGTYPCSEPWKGVVFPGNLMTVLTVAAYDETGGLSCSSGRGSAVDFAAFTNQPVHGLASVGNYAGLSGSSGATAVMAGLAALYISQHPTASRDQVLTALTLAASPTGYRSPLTGFGVPNAMCLVGQMCTAWIEGPTLIESSGSYDWTGRQAGSQGIVSYSWDTGATTQTVSRQVLVWPGMPEYSFTVTATIRDNTGRSYTVSKPVVVRDPYGSCPTCY